MDVGKMFTQKPWGRSHGLRGFVVRLWAASREGEEKVDPFRRKPRPWDTGPSQGPEARDLLQGGGRSANGPKTLGAKAAGRR